MVNGNFDYEIILPIGTISESKRASKEINIVRFGNNQPKIDLRVWTKEPRAPGKGVTLSKAEVETLYELLGSVVLKGVEMAHTEPVRNLYKEGDTNDG